VNALRAGVRKQVAAALNAAGMDVVLHGSRRHPLRRRVLLLNKLAVDVVYDVGANEGQYAQEIRSFGYTGRIVSFEPLAEPFRVLAAAAARDPAWRAINTAVGDTERQAEMYVAENEGASSSMLPMLDVHEINAPFARIVGREAVTVNTLDALIGADISQHARPFLKVDVQGYEDRVLAGAVESLPRFAGLQLELQLVPLYAGAPAFADVVTDMRSRAFVLVGIEPAFVGAHGILLAADGIFVRAEFVAMLTGVDAQTAW
jgi:FkbM family methyltransferase